MADDTFDEEDTLDEESALDETFAAYVSAQARKKSEAERLRSKRQVHLTNAALWITYLLATSIVLFVIISVFSETPTRLLTLPELLPLIATTGLALTVLFGLAAALIGSIKNKYAEAKSGRLFLMAFIAFACMAAVALTYRSR